MTDPLVPPEWRGDWNFSVVLQDEASGATTGGALYLTNIHRLFEPRDGKKSEAETYDWAGPAVSKSKALDTGAELRDRITSHPRIMVLNDEAHHVWDPGSAWSEAIRWLHEAIRKRTGAGLVAQLDFSATPKDNKGRIFPHVVCDTPLGEAVDAGIVKTPIIGRTKELVEQAHDDAAYRYEAHLRLGYERWKRSRAEWEKSGKKPLLFVMCTDTEAANQITARLNADSVFSDLNGKTINLHTNLKGKVKRRNIGGQTIEVFEESEKEISDEDLKAIRRISRELDRPDSPYSCIVSVLMLREGYQATLSERKPVEKAKQTLFNLVPCDQSLEVAMTAFLDNCADVSAFAKNAGPQALRIDYLTADQRLAFYRPDFFVLTCPPEVPSL